MKGRSTDISGMRFGRLLVLRKHDQLTKDKHTMWVCACDCGNEKVVARNGLTKGTASCGCIFEENKRNYGRKHGHHGTKLYNVWQGLFGRCYRPSHRSYARYGARGITVCDRWASFENFYEDMGATYAEGLDIDRIDNSGNYEPSNCRWVTRSENCRNRRNSKLTAEDVGLIKSILSAERTRLVKHIAAEFGVSPSVICGIRNGSQSKDVGPLVAY